MHGRDEISSAGGDDEGCWAGRDSQRLDLLVCESLGFHDLTIAIFGIR
jgi:hypothetical protein